MTKPQIAIRIFIALVFLLLIVDRFACKHGTTNNLAEMLSVSRDSTKYFRNKYNQEVATRRNVEGNLANLQAVYSKDSIEHIASRFKAKSKDIQQYTEVTSEGNSDIPLTHQDSNTKVTVTPHGDSCRQITSMVGSFENSYYKASVRLGDSPYHHLQAVDTLEVLTKDTTERHFLKKLHYSVINVAGRNPDNHYTITGAFKVEHPVIRTHWAVTLTGGIGYNVPEILSLLRHPQLQLTLGLSRIILKL
jgi:hypothetical protein